MYTLIRAASFSKPGNSWPLAEDVLVAAPPDPARGPAAQVLQRGALIVADVIDPSQVADVAGVRQPPFVALVPVQAAAAPAEPSLIR